MSELRLLELLVCNACNINAVLDSGTFDWIDRSDMNVTLVTLSP
jgi:hypothetical protein